MTNKRKRESLDIDELSIIYLSEYWIKRRLQDVKNEFIMLLKDVDMDKYQYQEVRQQLQPQLLCDNNKIKKTEDVLKKFTNLLKQHPEENPVWKHGRFISSDIFSIIYKYKFLEELQGVKFILGCSRLLKAIRAEMSDLSP